MYLIDEAGQAVSRQVPEPGPQDLQILVEHIAERIGRALEKQGLIERDMENAWLADFSQAGPLDDLVGIPSRNAAPREPGPRGGQKLFTLQTVAPRLRLPRRQD